jgi:ligand-binding sensor domain-containing protein/two-component sensor histidine kinase
MLCLVSLILPAQEPVFTNFSEEEGLPGRDVYDILNARNGYLWFATDNGVCRYDGNEFVNYSVSEGLPVNAILKLSEDSLGRIWFLGYNGSLSYYNECEGITACAFNDTIVKYFTDNYLDNIDIYPGDGMLIAPRRGGAAFIDQSGKIYLKSDITDPLKIDSCYLYFTDRGDQHFITLVTGKPGGLHSDGLLAYAPSGYYLKVEYSSRQFHRNYLRAGNDEYVVSYRDMAYYIRDRKIVSKRKFSHEVVSLYLDTRRHLWVSLKSDQGVYVFDHISMLGPKKQYMQGHAVTRVMQDREGNYWFSTEGDGLFFVPDFNFKRYTPADKERQLKVMAMAISGQRLFFTTRNKMLFSGRLHFGEISKIRPIDIGEPLNWIKYIALDGQGYLWLSSTEYLRYDPAGFPRPPDTVLDAICIARGRDNTIIVGSRNLGFYKDGRLVDLSETDHRKRIYAICEDHDETIWLGTLYGLYAFGNGEFLSKTHLHSRLNERISCIERTGDMLLVGTAAHGLTGVRNDMPVMHLNSRNGLTGDEIRSLFVQNDSVFWVGTRKGLNRCCIKSATDSIAIERFWQSDGLPSDEINAIGMHGGHMWLATGNGLVSFDPLRLTSNLVAPLIQINSIRIMGRDVEIKDQYVLEHDQNDIRISFSGIGFRSAGKMMFRYCMFNLNDEIIETRNQWVNFSNLAPGDYNFFLNVANANGVWNEKPRSIRFTIKKHYTGTVWFIILLILVTSSIFVAAALFFQRQRKMKEMVRHDLTLMEQKLFRLQMNPHFVFNALLAIQGFMYQNQAREAARYLTSFAKLIRHTLYGSSEEYIPLNQEIEALTYYIELQQLRFNEYFSFKIETDPELIAESVRVPSLMIQPFIENAIEHGLQHRESKGMLYLRFKMSGYDLMVEVEDNGIGREEAAKRQNEKGALHKSLGLEILSKRIRSLNLIQTGKILLEIIDLKDVQGKASGTLVRIIMPVKEN